MATLPFSRVDTRGEARFFFIMACVMALTIVAGFSFNIAAGRSSFGAPLLVHVHAVVFMGFVDWGRSFTHWVLSGTPGAERPMQGFYPGR